MISCGNKAADEAATEATDTVAVEEVETVDTVAAVDTVAPDTVAAAAEVK